MRLHTNPKAHTAYNFNYPYCRVKNAGLFKVTGSHIHCKCGNISQTVQDRDAIVATGNHNGKWSGP